MIGTESWQIGQTFGKILRMNLGSVKHTENTITYEYHKSTVQELGYDYDAIVKHAEYFFFTWSKRWLKDVTEVLVEVGTSTKIIILQAPSDDYYISGQVQVLGAEVPDSIADVVETIRAPSVESAIRSFVRSHTHCHKGLAIGAQLDAPINWSVMIQMGEGELREESHAERSPPKINMKVISE
jgi:hypothetical protein